MHTDLMETQAELKYLQQDLVRQQTLMDANAGVAKTLQKLQSEVDMKTAALKSIAKQLNYLGIPVTNLSPDNIVERVAIVYPIAGYITSLKMHNGMFVSPEMELMEIVSEDHLHLELDVFEKDIAHIREEQRISYTVPALGSTVYGGDVHIIGKEFNTGNKTVRIHGHLDKERPRFIKDLYIEAKIWLTDETVSALPETSVIKDGAFTYIYVANEEIPGDEVVFEKLRVVAGAKDKNYVAVKLIDTIPDNMKIVTSGAYYVYAQSKAGELEHNH